MSTLNELIEQVENPELKARIRTEVARLSKQKKFGLVFEEHLPECTPLYEIPVKKGATVALKACKANETYTVLCIDDGMATCERQDNHEHAQFSVADLVCVAKFGEAIYPYLKPIDSVCNAPDSSLWHALIEADNYHALQLLVYLYGGMVDCIYIDPPYNTGAKDWKYNNDYVDSNDSYRHSKWLSMMQKRLKLAKQLLNPKDSVLIVTIDEKEYLHLGCLLEEMFPEARIQMVSSVINPGGASRFNAFNRTNEFIYFVMFGNAAPMALPLNDEWKGNIKGGSRDTLRWRELRRTSTNSRRIDRPNLFYPIYLSTDGDKILGVGKPPSFDEDYGQTKIPYENAVALYPIQTNGEEGNWRLSSPKFMDAYQKGYVRIGKYRAEKTALSFLAEGERAKVEQGLFPIIGRKKDGSIIVDESKYEAKFIPGTQWWISSHDATQLGTKVLNSIIGEKRFSFPKSLYAVHDTIRFFVANKPNALIVDFFAGSGTTLHAVNLLNVEDGGNRRCIMVTNNEVSADEAKEFLAKGVHPGDDEWNAKGIARYVTWPRTVCSIEGHDVNGKPLQGKYLGSDLEMSAGFKANAAFFHLGFLDKNAVAIGRQFKELLPLLWMKAGAIGPCPKLPMNKPLPEYIILPENRFAVLIDENAFHPFSKELAKAPEIDVAYIVTDSERGYRQMISKLNIETTFQLYRDYLDNFRINKAR
ncbi:MAG: site-specific DNA-methyltransferase [Fibrobacter sp.]|nr:site-specific DNA-methyltransferase [Fibrobacter sp.]